jgi:hypothetical protein
MVTNTTFSQGTEAMCVERHSSLNGKYKTPWPTLLLQHVPKKMKIEFWQFKLARKRHNLSPVEKGHISIV